MPSHRAGGRPRVWGRAKDLATNSLRPFCQNEPSRDIVAIAPMRFGDSSPNPPGGFGSRCVIASPPPSVPPKAKARGRTWITLSHRPGVSPPPLPLPGGLHTSPYSALCLCRTAMMRLSISAQLYTETAPIAAFPSTSWIVRSAEAVHGAPGTVGRVLQAAWLGTPRA